MGMARQLQIKSRISRSLRAAWLVGQQQFHMRELWRIHQGPTWITAVVFIKMMGTVVGHPRQDDYGAVAILGVVVRAGCQHALLR
jgi:hypothetical protein